MDTPYFDLVQLYLISPGPLLGSCWWHAEEPQFLDGVEELLMPDPRHAANYCLDQLTVYAPVPSPYRIPK